MHKYKLINDDVIKIYKFKKEGKTQEKIAKKLNCSQSLISQILTGKRGSDVKIPSEYLPNL